MSNDEWAAWLIELRLMSPDMFLQRFGDMSPMGVGAWCGDHMPTKLREEVRSQGARGLVCCTRKPHHEGYHMDGALEIYGMKLITWNDEHYHIIRT